MGVLTRLVSEGRGRLIKTKGHSYLIYVPKDIAEDSQFPFPLKHQSTLFLKISFERGKDELLIEKWIEGATEEK